MHIKILQNRSTSCFTKPCLSAVAIIPRTGNDSTVIYAKGSVQDRKFIFNSSSNKAVKNKADNYSRHSDI